MGYVIPHKEKSLSLGDGFRLTGFITAVGARGIMALRAVSENGHVSDWLGSPDGLPVSIRLCMRDRIETLRGCFDALKLISLSVPKTMTPLSLSSTTTHLRATALWYPSVPLRTHNLHDEALPPSHMSPLAYRPLVHVMFRGSNGSFLKHLIRISVTLSRYAIVRVDFIYASVSETFNSIINSSLDKHMHILTQDGGEIRTQSYCSTSGPMEMYTEIPFIIDGPAGERLIDIQGSVGENRERLGYKAVTTLNVTTNNNCKFTFQPSSYEAKYQNFCTQTIFRAVTGTVDEEG